MLPFQRSIFLKVCVISVFAVKCQSYEYDHDIEGYEGDDSPSKTDYTKYFNRDAATAESQQTGINTAFINNPVKDPFQSFFFQSPIAFNANGPSFAAESSKKEVVRPFDHLQSVRSSILVDGRASASNDNPLATDYFEAAQKKLQAKDDDVIKPGPHYVSHQVPVPKSFKDLQKAYESRDDVETIRPPVKKSNRNKDDDYNGFNAYDVLESLKSGQNSKPESYLYGTGKDVDYNTGKSSSTVSQYPAASGLAAVLRGVPTTTVSSHLKYNFETTPVALQSKYLENLVSTTPIPSEKPVFEPEIEGISEAASNNCRRIASPEKAEDMNCFVCQDGKAKYTQCSYSSGDDDGAESRIHFSTPIRYKRSPRRRSYDPYLASKSRSEKAFEEFEKDHAAAESERQKDFHYVPWSPEEAESYSEQQSEEVLKDKESDCKKVEKDGVTCTVCKNAKTGGNFESCSYASAPKEHKYAYVAEKKYDSNDDEPVEKESSASEKEENSEPSDDESKVSEVKAEATESVPAITSYPLDKHFPELIGAGTVVHEPSGKQNDDGDEESDDNNDNPESGDDDDENKPESDDGEDDDEKEKKESASDDEPSYYNFNFDEQPYKEEASEKKEKTEGESEDDWDSYHYKIFPEFHKGSEQSETQTNEEKAPPPEKQDVEDVLAEFSKKDRSKCKRAERNGMTCFLCVDQNKVQHEECMFIQESKPKATHVAYHELQRLKDPKSEEPAESKTEKFTHQPLTKPNDLPRLGSNPIAPTDTLPSPSNKRKQFFKKVKDLRTPELAVAASENVGTWVAFDQPKKHFRKNVNKADLHVAASAPDSERLEDEHDDEKETSASNSNDEKASESSDDKQRDEEADDAPVPKEIDVGENEGAYSHETKPVYSKLYGTTLPKYMVEKTEFEKDFDAASGFD